MATTNSIGPEFMSISLIFARSRNHCIGANNRIPWRLPDEFAHFKRTTMGKPIIMGRKTYEDHESALPGRLNIVVTSQADYQAAEGIVCVGSLEKAIALGKENSDEVFVIGGVAFFTAGFEIATTVYETIVDADIDGDAFLPAFDFSGWSTEKIDEHEVDERHVYAYDVFKHVR